MPSIEYMRNYVREMYKGERWARRVRQMTDNQIMAIYMKRNPNVNKPKPEPPRSDF